MVICGYWKLLVAVIMNVIMNDFDGEGIIYQTVFHFDELGGLVHIEEDLGRVGSRQCEPYLFSISVEGLESNWK